MYNTDFGFQVKKARRKSTLYVNNRTPGPHPPSLLRDKVRRQYKCQEIFLKIRGKGGSTLPGEFSDIIAFLLPNIFGKPRMGGMSSWG